LKRYFSIGDSNSIRFVIKNSLADLLREFIVLSVGDDQKPLEHKNSLESLPLKERLECEKMLAEIRAIESKDAVDRFVVSTKISVECEKLRAETEELRRPRIKGNKRGVDDATSISELQPHRITPPGMARVNSRAAMPLFK